MTLFDLNVPAADRELIAVADDLLRRDPDGQGMAKAFRTTFDQLYDGQHTGRYSVEQLFKTEKTHFGTLIEINLQRELQLPDGRVLDFNIAGVEVDCKYSHTGAWMLPIESFDHLALVTEADDRAAIWSAGLVRVTSENRRTSENRDRKTGLNAHGRASIEWLFRDRPMQPNVLLQLPSFAVAKIMSLRSGQARLNELFRQATNCRISRTIIATVAQQDDYMKRVRDNGGSRSALRPEGYIILSGDYLHQRRLAAELGCEVPDPGELVSIRVVPEMPGRGALIGDSWWRLATRAETPTVPAPVVVR